MKKIIFIGWHHEEEVLNGPSNIFNSITKEIPKFLDKGEYQVISPETFNKDSKKALLYITKLILKSKGNIFLINGNGLKFPYVVYILCHLSKKNDYYLLSHGLRIVEDKYLGVEGKSIYYSMEKYLINKFPNIIAISEFLKSKIIENTKRNKPIYIINNGLEYINKPKIKKTFLEGRSIHFVTTGGVKRVKGIEEMIEVIHNINSKEKEYKVYLDIYGGYDDKCLYESVLEGISKDPNGYVKYKGIVKKEELYEVYSQADFYLGLSNFDTFNMSVLESLSQYTPAIITDTCGISEILEYKKQGIVIHKGDSYFEIIKSFLESLDEDAYEAMRDNSRTLYEENTMDKSIKRYLSLLRKE
ncbi:glycosyltransferase family 4 protein [Clostridium algidicarnis]|uniref:glycosyltransferase family 4 protein n=1 Tax=Clostridium algidicarnis TaxID=37659 RepID=UPI001C0D09E5|nr:glycosyltransferase family 4 protein [Clostridium algidicarnis]MBU3209285.1 glycosyltransferase family 4 protein [Clostridium algidicarnis]MBU3228000.1 glycosyltransferase family 4 protein [Clostridium algidicarnis]MBU3251829.1 glycosyltransferase family 4 protein [Clostridium algidicarnis]